MITRIFPDLSKLRQVALISAASICLLIVYLSLVSASALPSIEGSDKLKHVAAYCALTAPLAIGLGRRRIGAALLIAVAIGVALEFGQIAIGTGRSGEMLDALANLIGAMMGAGLAYLFERFFIIQIYPRH